MATLPRVMIPKGVWVDVNDETSIAVGLALLVQNVSKSGDCWLCEKVTEPVINVDGAWLIRPSEEKVNGVGAVRVWAYSHTGSIIQVGEA